MKRSVFFVAAVLLAAFTGCGGGGAQLPPGQPASPGPTSVPTPTSTPPDTTSVQLQGSYYPQTVTMPALHSGYGATVTFSGTNTIAALQLVLASSVSPNVPAVSGHVRRATIGGTPSPLVFLTMTPAAQYALYTLPKITFSVPSSVTTGTPLGLAFYDPTQPSTGWTLVSSSFVNAASVTFPAGGPSPLLLPSNSYVLALVTLAGLPTPAPTPGGTGFLQFAFTNAPVGALSEVQSVVISVNGTALPAVPLTTVTAGNYGRAAARVQLNAVSNASVSAVLYPTANGTGTPIGFSHGTADVIGGLTTTVGAPVDPVLKGLSIAPDTTTVASGTPTTVNLTITPGGPSGLPPWPNWYDASGNKLTFTTTVSDPTGQTSISQQPTPTATGSAHYSGIGSGPAVFTASAGSFHSQYGLSYTPHLEIFASIVGTGKYYPQPLLTLAAAGAASRLFSVNFGISPGPYTSAFDPNRNVWSSDGTKLYEFNPSGALVTTIPLSSTELLLGFGQDGTMYTGTAPGSSTPAFFAYSISGATRTLLRTYALPAPPAALSSAPDGTLFVTTASGGAQQPAVYEYAPAATSPSMWTFSNVGPTAVDANGNVYLVKNDLNVYEWQTGTPITATPAIIATEGSTGAQGLTSIAVNPDGYGCAIGFVPDVFQAPAGLFSQIGFSPAGPSTAWCPQTAEQSISAPIR